MPPVILLMAVGILFACSAVSAFEEGKEEQTVVRVIHENPLCGGAGTQYETVALDGDALQENAIQAYSSDSVPFFSTLDAASEYFRNCMRNRLEHITLAIPTSQSTVVSDITSIYRKALMYEDMVHPTDGDYLRFMYGFISCSDTRIPDSRSAARWTLHYTVYYYTTLEQEQMVTQRIRQVLDGLGIASLPYESRIRAIYDYICSHVVYDRNTYPSYAGRDVLNGQISLKEYQSSKAQFTAYNALLRGTSVCQGYATLLYRMLIEASVPNRIVIGTSGGVLHAWNLIKVGQWYYNADSTWDAGKNPYNYYLKGENEFTGHVRNSNEVSNILDYTSLSFLQAYPTAGLTVLPADAVAFADGEETSLYTGKALTPEVVVPGLVKGVDYSVSYADNVQPGSMTVTVTGIGSCMGTVKLHRTIRREIQQEEITLADPQPYYAYTGREICPAVRVGSLVEGKDYRVTYSNNVEPGKMTILVEGIHDCTGSRTLTCEIFRKPVIGKTVSLKQTAATTSSATITWARTENATGYQVFYYHPTQKKYIRFYQGKAASCVLQESVLTTGKRLYVKVRPYYQRSFSNDGGTGLYTAFGTNSDNFLVTALPATEVVKHLSSTGGKVNVTWARLNQCNGYQVQVSSSPKFSSSVTDTYTIHDISKISYTFSSLKKKALVKNNRYYVRVRSFRKTTTATFYGAFSIVKTVTVR